MIYNAKSPTRVDLAGGTLDCWPLYALSGWAQTTNLSISIYTYADLEPLNGSQVEIEIKDLKFKRNYKSVSELLADESPELSLVKSHIRFWRPEQGFRLSTRSESPVGGGLGGSSSLCVSLIKAFSQWQGKKLTTLEVVTLAHNLEAEVLRKPTGTQDYFPAIEPGLNIIDYGAMGPRLENLKVDEAYFSQRMILVYTGQPHHSGLNNWQVIKAAIDGDAATNKSLQRIREVGQAVANVCRAKAWAELPALFREEFKARVQLSAGFTSERIEELERISLGAGADAVKICGAGGGGCVMVWTKPEMKTAVVSACQKSGFQVLDAVPVVH